VKYQSLFAGAAMQSVENAIRAQTSVIGMTIGAQKSICSLADHYTAELD